MTDYTSGSRPSEIPAVPSQAFSAVDHGLPTRHDRLYSDELTPGTDLNYLVRLQRNSNGTTHHHAMTPEGAEELADQLKASAQAVRDRQAADLAEARAHAEVRDPDASPTLGEALRWLGEVDSNG
jgi:hypothetical protein